MSNPWHKRYHSDALAGFMGLSLEERGAYQTFLDLFYDRGGPVPDNDRLLAGYMGASVRKWKSLRNSLIEKGKIEVDEDGNLFNSRALKMVEKAAKTSRKRAENGLKGADKKRENAKKGNENRGGAEILPEQSSGYTRATQKPEARSNTTTSESLTAARERDQFDGTDDRLLQIMKIAHMTAPPPDIRLLSEWLSWPEQHFELGILPVVKRLSERAIQSGDPPRMLKYFHEAVRADWEAHIRERNRIRDRIGKPPLLKVVGED